MATVSKPFLKYDNTAAIIVPETAPKTDPVLVNTAGTVIALKTV